MTIITKEEGNRQQPFNRERLKNYIERVTEKTDEAYFSKVCKSIEQHETFSAEGITKLLINTALENVDEVNTHWTFEAAKIYLQDLYKKASRNRSYDAEDKYGDFYGLQKVLASKGIYSANILEKYTKEEIKELSQIIDPSRDQLFDYTGIHLLSDRYLVRDHERNVYELPQERWLVIAMFLMQNETKDKRHGLVKKAYWALSNLYMTVATPTLKSAGLVGGQLSSCFIDTVDDSLQSIYDTNTDIAKNSKFGGGIGVYMGKVRGRGAAIRGHKGTSSGVVPWIKQLNNTAVSVDQLGTRKGAIAIYLDVWHMDIEPFLDLKLNNGDDRLRAHDIFLGACIPDYFMEKVESRGDWYLFDPHEVRQVMGYSLEDFFDEEKGKGSFREKYEECVSNNNLSKKKVSAIDIMKRMLKSQLESGTPFMFYRDQVNRMNANSHAGIIYCSNLCTEITQNMSPTQFLEEYVDDEGYIIKKYKSGDYVVCNLSSINYGRAVPNNVLEELIPIEIRMLHNVIELNSLPVKQTELTNQKYQAIGLGGFGWHHLLALEGIHWESEEAIEYADKLYEKVAYLAIKASMELAKEKKPYAMFEGSDWQTGAYFDKRNYSSSTSELNWDWLKEQVREHGVANGYIMATAPNGSTSVIAGSSASVDPIFETFFYEEKKDYRLPVVAPDLSYKTYEYYKKTAYQLDQFQSIKQNAARQRHVDQSLSFNLYVPNTIKASVLLALHLSAWEEGLKTTYYVRSTSTTVENCEWCEG